MKEARVIGLLTGTPSSPRVAYLAANAEIDLVTIPNLGPVAPTEVFRIAARCEEHRCAQFSEGRCSLGKRIVEGLPPVVDALPPCTIRNACRWYAEQGRAACLRCPQVITLVPEGSGDLSRVARLPAREAEPDPSAANQSDVGGAASTCVAPEQEV